MRLIADSSSIISALIKDSSSRKIINKSSLRFIIPEYIFTEIDEHKEDILSKSKMDRNKLDLMFSMIKEKVEIIPESEIKHRDEAKEIMDKIDPDDTIFVALGLSIKNNGIWSDDKHFEKQDRIKVWKTKDLLNYINK